MDNYDGLFSELKRLADELPLGVAVSIGYDFRACPSVYDKNQQPQVVRQHQLKLKSDNAATGSEQSTASSKKKDAGYSSSSSLRLRDDRTSDVSTNSQIRMEELFPPAEYIRLPDVKRRYAAAAARKTTKKRRDGEVSVELRNSLRSQ